MSAKYFYVALFFTAVLLSSSSYGDWKTDANSRIEQYRKGDFRITAISPYGSKPPLSDVVVDVNQIKHHFAFGTCISDTYISNTNYANFIRNHYEWGVCENASKWQYNEKTRDSVNFSGADLIYNWCAANGIIMRGHCLFWEQVSCVQSWVQALPYATYPTSSDLLTEVNERIYDAVNHFKGKFVHWDVDNEMLPTGSNYRFYDRLGGAGRVHMFQYANQVDPNCKLFVNEYSGNSWVPYAYDSWPYVTLINNLRNQGAPIHGIGIQSHLGTTSSFDPARYYSSTINPLAALGLPIWVTEFDVNQPNDTLRADIMENFYRIAFSHPSVEGIIMWGFWQGHTWQRDWYIVNSNWTLNATGQRYEALMNEWTTKDSSTTDSNGNADFRGFYGKYRVTLAPPQAGPDTVAIIDVTPGGQNEFTIELAGIGEPTACDQVLDLGLTLEADLNGDCYVNYADLEIIANHWLATGCGEFNNYCDWADIEADNDVDFVDFSLFGLQWMQCNDPQDPACTPNW